jgi:hypothetical protein
MSSKPFFHLSGYVPEGRFRYPSSVCHSCSNNNVSSLPLPAHFGNFATSSTSQTSASVPGQQVIFSPFICGPYGQGGAFTQQR